MNIYHEDIANCNNFLQASPANFKRGLFFVLATIQQQLETVPAIVADFETMGTASRYAFGFKATGIDYINANFETLHRDALRAKDKPAKLLKVLLQVPGFGVVKAGFAAQLFSNLVGCIDVHNITLYGVPMSALRYNRKLKPPTLRRKRADYIGLCNSLGGSAFLWSQWCDHVARIRPNNWENGRAVSLYHFEVISGLETGGIIDLFSGIEYEPKFKLAA